MQTKNDYTTIRISRSQRRCIYDERRAGETAADVINRLLKRKRGR